MPPRSKLSALLAKEALERQSGKQPRLFFTTRLVVGGRTRSPPRAPAPPAPPPPSATRAPEVDGVADPGAEPTDVQMEDAVRGACWRQNAVDKT
jgi:hypothetical protein